MRPEEGVDLQPNRQPRNSVPTHSVAEKYQGMTLFSAMISHCEGSCIRQECYQLQHTSVMSTTFRIPLDGGWACDRCR